jgi:hypothetical protein
MPLINSADYLRTFLSGIQRASTDPVDIAAEVDLVEQEVIVPILGTAQFAALQTAFDGEANGVPWQDADLEALWRKVAYVIAPLVYYKKLPGIYAKMGGNGVTINAAEGTVPVTKWGFEKLSRNLLDRGVSAIDALYKFLDESTPGTYALWEASGSYTQHVGQLIQTTAQFNEVCPAIGNNRRVFMALKPIIQQAIDFNIIPIIGQAQYDTLIANLLSKTTSADEDKLISRLRYAIAHFAMAQAYDQFEWCATPSGLSPLIPALPGDYDFETPVQLVDASRLTGRKQWHLQLANEYLTNMLVWLNINSALFADYHASDEHTNNTPTTPTTINHSGSNTYMM